MSFYKNTKFVLKKEEHIFHSENFEAIAVSLITANG